jgi:cobalt-zinc-cadmium resistance protein CzcA
MFSNSIDWALKNPLAVLLLAAALAGYGTHAFLQVNVEAYPDPAPAIIEVVARFPGASAEEVERQVTIPLEVALAGMPGLTDTRSQSLFELGHIRSQFDYDTDHVRARQEVINRLPLADLPPGVEARISPQSPTGEIFRYRLVNPRDSQGQPIYNLNDLKALQDWTIERRLRRIPRVAGVTSFGGTVKRYEIHPDPGRMQRYHVSLQQIKDAVSESNSNVGAEYVVQGEAVQVVRSLGLVGEGRDPADQAMALADPIAARDLLRSEEQRRIRELRQIVLTVTNNVPVRLDDIVEGGPLMPGEKYSPRGIVVGHQTRLGRVRFSRSPAAAAGLGSSSWDEDNDIIQAVVLLRKGEESLPALRDINALVEEFNTTPGRLLPGVKIEPFYDRTQLIDVTSQTVQGNLLAGMALVVVILLMFLNNVRSALIVAINIPLALLFAFSVLYLRGKSANLLSIGAVDFGIIVDSSVIMVENTYRHLTSGLHADLPWEERIARASREILRSLFFSTAIMVCAFLPLFTMTGPEGQLFGPMAQTYALALGGALLLALLLSPVLCSLLLRSVKPRAENWFIRRLQSRYLLQLRWCLSHRVLTLAVFAAVVAVTVAALPLMGREFMPELEEGNIWVQAALPLNSSLAESSNRLREVCENMQRYPEIETIVGQVGRPDDGTDPAGFYSAEIFLPLKPQDEWPIPPGHDRPRTKEELIEDLDRQVRSTVIGATWNFSQNIRNMVLEATSGVRGENSVKIIGPDLETLESISERVSQALRSVPGIEDVGVYRILGQTNLVFSPDRGKCALWGVSVDDLQGVIGTAVGGRSVSQMIEGERSFDITVRWPEALRSNETAILNIPVEVGNNLVIDSASPGIAPTTITGASGGPSPLGARVHMPPITGSASNGAMNDLTQVPRRRIIDLVTPRNSQGQADPQGSFLQLGASDIYREQGRRLIAVKFDVRHRDLASAVTEARQKTASLVPAPYQLEWSGEFQNMQQAEARLKIVIPLACALIFVLLYCMFRSLIDVLLVFSSVVAICCGGFWALILTHTNFSISAAVGFISIFGVAVMNGLLLVSSCHQNRLAGMNVEHAILRAAKNRLRPMMMTTLTAIFGLLPAALSTRIGAQSQQPLAIVVIGGMLAALVLNRYLIGVLYAVFRKGMPAEGAAGLAE